MAHFGTSKIHTTKTKGNRSKRKQAKSSKLVDLKAGDQVFIQYDLNKSNDDMALDCGFVESSSGTNHESITLTLQISESDEFFDDKLDIAETNGLGETAYFDTKLDLPLPPTMLPYLRLVALEGTDTFLLEALFRNAIWGHLESPVSRASEELICQVAPKASKCALSAYQTTIAEDEKLIEEGKLGSRHMMAVRVRAGEKRVLQYVNRVFRGREDELAIPEYYQDKRLKDSPTITQVSPRENLSFVSDCIKLKKMIRWN